jgi:hypothetical protein
MNLWRLSLMLRTGRSEYSLVVDWSLLQVPVILVASAVGGGFADRLQMAGTIELHYSP